MSHEVETMAYRNETPWHGLGVNLNDVVDSITAEEFLRYAGLDWAVSLESITAGGLTAPDHFAVVRTGDGVHDILGVVGKAYHVVQNSELFGLPNDLVDAGLIQYECAGSLFNGRQVWALARLADVNIVRKYTGTLDAVERFLLWTARHDGEGGIVGGTTGVRVVCRNTMDAAFSKGLGDRVNIAHRSFASNHLAMAHEFFADRIRQSAEFEREAQCLADKAMTVDTFRNVAGEWLDTVRGEVKTDNGRDARKALVEELVTFFGEGAGNTGETAWDGFNGITEWMDHQKSRYEDASRENQERFMFSTLMGDNYKRKGRALALLKKA